MLLAPRTDQLRTFRVRRSGRIDEGEAIPLRNTLFGHAFEGKEAALLRLDVPEGKDFDALAERMRLIHAIQEGVRGYHVLGSGHGVKDGKLYATSPEVLARLRPYFDTAEDALAYGGLLFSESSHVLKLSKARMTGKGDGDGQGWIDADVLREHGLPLRQMQIRALWPTSIAKGTLVPVEGLRTREGVEVLFHETQVKSRGKDLRGAFLLAIRETACVRTYKSSWTWTQFLDEEVQDQLFDRYGRPALASVERAMTSNDAALAYLDAIQVEGEEEEERRDLLTTFLAAGLSPRHPWVHRRLGELVRRSYLDAALGLGPIPLTAGMAAVAEDDRCRHEITCNWIPEGVVTILRYPVRDGMSLRLARNVHRQGAPEGSILVSPRLMEALDGDFDGDWVAVCEDPLVRRSVKQIHRAQPPRLPIPPRTRKRSPLTSLARVAVECLGASGIGTPTWYLAASVAEDRLDLVPRLSLELQTATMSLKWNVAKDWGILDEVAAQVELPQWLELSKDRGEFAGRATKVPEIGLGRLWNRCVDVYEKDVGQSSGALREFLDIVPLPTGDADVLTEVETYRQAFNQRIATSEGDEDEITAALETVRRWAAGKTGSERIECARSAWYLAHRSASPRSTASFAIHAFPDVVVEDIAQRSTYRAPVLVGPSRSNQLPDIERLIEVIEGRRCLRASVRPKVAIEKGPRRPTKILRLIGGWRAIAESYGVPEKEAVEYLARVLGERSGEPAELFLSWVTTSWCDRKVLRAELAGDVLGFVAPETTSSLPSSIEGSHPAMLLLRGRTVYATLTA